MCGYTAHDCRGELQSDSRFSSATLVSPALTPYAYNIIGPGGLRHQELSSYQAQIEQRQLWDAYTTEAETKLKAAGVQFVQADKAAFFKATQPIRDKYGAKYAALTQRILDTK